MPRRRDKRTDTQNSDEYQDIKNSDHIVHFGTVKVNRFLAPDQIQGDDASKYVISAWSNTLNAQRLLPWNERKVLFQRAITYLPYSYKIWHMYLVEYMEFCSTRSLLSKQYKLLNQTFERALQKLPKMPKIWLMYCECLTKQNLISKTRSVYNWSFRNLPLTQHQKIWQKFTKWVMSLDNTSTALSTIPRYLKLNPDFKQQFADYLYQKQQYNYCVNILQQILKDDGYSSKAKMTKQDFHLKIVDIITQHPQKCQVNGQSIIRQAIAKYKDARGNLWIKLSDYYTRKGQFQLARTVLQQALDSIDSVKDFGMIFSAFCKLQQQMITALANQQNRLQSNIVKQDFVDQQIQKRLQKLSILMKSRPYLLHQIILRKNQNNIKHWISLSRLYAADDKPLQQLKTLQQALLKIKPEQVFQGKLSDIVIQIAKIYQKQGNISKVNQTMFQGTSIHYRMFEDYYSIWVSWTQILLQQHYYQDALKIIKHVLFKKKIHTTSPQQQLIKNNQQLLRTHTGIWQLYIDLEISFGNFQSLKLAYERCKQYRCLTPSMLLNFTQFLWQNGYFQQSLRVFQYAVSNFSWPSLYDIWISYINKFTTRYGSDGIGVQRTRSMFEKVLKQVPKDKCKIFYFFYAQFQQQYGLYSHAIQIYDRMVNNVPIDQRYQAYNIYIAKVSKLLGITKTRAIFDTALKNLNQKQTIQMGRKYADIQTKMGQIQRSRSIYIYISQFTDPRDDRKKLWQQWQNFQTSYGDRDSYKQYLRIKRSVQSKFLMLPPDFQKIQQQVKKTLTQHS